MFQQRIQTAFNGSTADEMFPFVKGESPYDGVLHSVLRATLDGKIGDDTITTRHNTVDFSGHGFDDEVFCGYDSQTITFISNEGNQRIPEWVPEKFTETHPGWERVQRVSSFFERLFDCTCFINQEQKSTVVIVGRLDTGRMHYILCSIFAMLPWYYKKETVTPEDIELVKSLREPSYEKFLAAIAEFEGRYDFYTPKIRSLGDYESEWEGREISRMQRKSDNLRDRLDGLYRDLAEYTKQKSAIDRQILGWKLGTSEREYTIKQYLIDNAQKVRFVSADDDGMTVEILTDLVYFDDELAEDVYDSTRDLINETRTRNAKLTKEEMKLLFKALFLDKSIILRFCAAYRLNVSGCRVDALGEFDFDSAAAKYMPNPHINRYTCIGGYEQGFIKCMSAQNYIGAIEQAIASCQSLNFADGTVMEYFMKTLYETDKRCLVMNGLNLTPKEAVDELKKKGEE